MAQIIKVTPEILKESASAISGLAREYQDLYQKLYGLARGLTDIWSGEDNKAFVERINGFEDDLITMYDLLNKYVKYLNDTAKSYEDTQTEIIRRANGLKN